MPYWPQTFGDLVDASSKIVTVAFGVVGGIWVYFQFTGRRPG